MQKSGARGKASRSWRSIAFFGAVLVGTSSGLAWMTACGGDDATTSSGDDASTSDVTTTTDTGGGGDASADGGADVTAAFPDATVLTAPSNLTSDDIPVGLLLQPDGKYIAVAGNTDHYAVVMARRNADGSPDTTFGQGGFVWGQQTYARGAALQADGKIVLAGYVGAARYDAEGALDTTFQPPTFAQGLANIESVALQPDGKILLGGTDGSNLRVQRLLATGAFDTTFDTDGSATVSFGPQSSAYSVAVDPTNGKVAAAGYAGGQFALAVWNSDGSPDATFNTTGHITGAGLFSGSQGAAVTFQPDHKIVIVGVGTGDGGAGSVAVRFNTDGTPDTGFGSGGVFKSGSGSFSSITSVANGGFVLGRYNGCMQITANGTIDGTFGSGGNVSFASLPSSAQMGPAMVVGAGGTLAAFGALAPGGANNTKSMWRYTSAGAIDTTFGSAGQTTFQFFAREDVARVVMAQPDGKLVLGGQSTGYGMIARFTANGVLDTAFAQGGVRVAGEQVQGLALGAGGTIYVANDFGAEALTPNGVNDPSFGGDGGVSSLKMPSGDWYEPRSIALDAQGRVLLGGYGGGARPEHVGVMRLLATGAKDGAFGNAGAYEGPTDNERIFAVAVDANQKTVVAGFSGAGAGASQKILLLRFDTAGALDATFDGDTGTGNGIVTTTTASGLAFEMARKIAIQPDGKILVLANGSNGGFYDTYDAGATEVLRYLEDGKLDTTFGSGGVAFGAAFTGFSARGMELRPDGSILLGGTKYGTNGAMAAMRLTPAGAVDATFGTGGVFVAPTKEVAEGWSVATGPGGRAFVSGSLTHSPTGADFALAVGP